ncbi:hypothetical protein GCM10023325_02660 [Sphingomonas lutea]
MVADAQAAKVGKAGLANPQRAGAHPPGVGIVEHDDPSVRGQPQVAFDARTKLQRGGEGDQAVFGKGRAIVQSAMRETERPRRERVNL